MEKEIEEYQRLVGELYYHFHRLNGIIRTLEKQIKQQEDIISGLSNQGKDSK